MEAIPKGGVRAISIENYKEVYDLCRIKDRSSFDLSEVIAYLIRMLAREYDFKSTLKLGWKLSLRKMGLVLRRLQASGEWLVRAVSWATGFPLFRQRSWHTRRGNVYAEICKDL